MTNSRWRLHLGIVTTLALAGAVVAAAEPPRVGGLVGYGITAVRQPGAFRWDFDSTHEDTVLAVLKLSAGTPALRGFVALGARLDGTPSAIGPEFELREAALRSVWRPNAQDSAAVRLFARQPGSLWIESALAAPITALAAGADDALGARADVAWRRASATWLVVDRAGLGPRFDAVDNAAPAAAATGEAMVLRLGADGPERAQLRFGATWTRLHPDAGFVQGVAADSRHRDVLGGDVRAGWRGVWGALSYAESSPEFGAASVAPTGVPAEHGWRSEWSGRLTDIMPSNAALRAELRAPGLGLGRWGTLGLAPQYRALGTAHVDRLVAPEHDAGAPRRGLEGYRLEAWYTLPVWPVWLRQVYDRHQQFRDADRRVVLQRTECQVLFTNRVHGRVQYVQQDERLPSSGRREHHDDLIGEFVAEDSRARARLQGGIVDLHSPYECTVLALETAAHVGSRVQGLARLSVASEGGRTRRAFWAELQYWHLPEFELALQYGPEWIGDGSDPALDSDLTADGDDVDRIRLHFRGWF